MYTATCRTTNEKQGEKRLLLLYAIEAAVPVIPQLSPEGHLCPQVEEGPAPDFERLGPHGPTPRSSSW